MVGSTGQSKQGLAQDHWEALLPSPRQAREERENWMDATKAAAPPSAPFSIRSSLHLTDTPALPNLTMPALLPSLTGSLTAGAHREGDAQNWDTCD